MNPLNLIPDSVKDKLKTVVGEPLERAFNEHPKTTAIILIALGIILAVAAMAVFIGMGVNPLAYPGVMFALIPTLILGVGITFALHLFLRSTKHEQAAYAVLKIALPILGILGSMIIGGHGVLDFLHGDAGMMDIALVVGGGVGVGASIYYIGKHTLPTLDRLRRGKRRTVRRATTPTNAGGRVQQNNNPRRRSNNPRRRSNNPRRRNSRQNQTN